MNIIFKVIIFTLLLNFSAGIMELLVVHFNVGDDGGSFIVQCYKYDDTRSNAFTGTMSNAIDPNSQTQDQTSAFIRLIDGLNIGIVGAFLTIKQYFYGLLDFIDCFILQSEALQKAFLPIRIILATIISIMYIIGAIYLWTGRIINK